MAVVVDDDDEEEEEEENFSMRHSCARELSLCVIVRAPGAVFLFL